MMTKTKNTDQLIDHILASKTFADSEKTRSLFQYLYDESQARRIPKEIDIAIDVFKRGKDFNPAEDTIVRVALHKLRQKLAIFYDTEGRRDKYRISIPRGQYQLIIEKTKNKSFKKFVFSKMLNYLLSFALIVVLLLLVHLKREEHKRQQAWDVIPANHPVWAEILNSDRPLVLALGDLYLIKDLDNSAFPGVVMRETSINSDWQFNAYLSDHPEFADRLVSHTRYHFLPEYCYTSIADMLSSFIYHNVDVTIMSASELTAEQFSESNIIFIGYYKTSIAFNHFFQNFAFNVDIYDEKIAGLDIPGGVVSPADDPQKYHSDISYAAKVPGPNGNVIFLFMGFRLAGVQDVVRQFSTNERLAEITSVLDAESDSFPLYFQIVSRVEGFARKDIHSEIIDLYMASDSL